MPGKIIIIRLRQFYRLVSHIGAFRIIFLLLLTGFVGFTAWNVMEEPGYTMGFTIIIAISLLSVHITRKDKKFLRTMTVWYFLIFCVEYFLIILPFMVIALLVSNLIAAAILLLICLVIPFVNLNTDFQGVSSLLKFLINPFTPQNNFRLNIKLPVKNPLAFEWISGLRSNIIILIPLYLVVLAFSYRAIVAPVGILLISLLVSGFYYHGESREFIEIFAYDASGFIVRKMLIAIKLLSFLLIPIVLVSILFQTTTWYFIVGAVIISYIFQAITIIFKYALFSENSDLHSNSMIVMFNIICILLPFLWPFPVIMGIRYYFKAKRNLKPYFDDYNS